MKRTKSRFMSVVLVCVMLLGMLPVMQTTASAASEEDAIRARIDELTKLNYSYFTVNQNTCSSYWIDSHGCSNCLNSSVVNEKWLRERLSMSDGNTYITASSQFPALSPYDNGSGYTCYGFATFAEWYIYRKDDLDTIRVTELGTYPLNSNLSNVARIGDAIRLGNSHFAIYIGTTNSGIEIIDCNGLVGNGLNSRVRRRELPYNNGAWSTVTVFRSTTPISYCSYSHSAGAKTNDAWNFKTIKKSDGIYTAVCKNCGTEFVLGALDVSSAGTYKVNKANASLCTAPYQDSGFLCPLKGAEYNIVGSIINAYGSKWYKTSDENWIYSGDADKIAGVSTPATPSNLSISKIDNRNARISWSAVSGATSYNVQYKRSGIDWTTDTDYTGGTSYVSTYLDYDPYYFRVCAVNSAGSSEWTSVTYYRYGNPAQPTTTTPTNTATTSTKIELTGMKSEYKETDSITFSWPAIPNAVTYTLEVQTYREDGTKGILQSILDVKQGMTKKLDAGTYSARISYKLTKYGESTYGDWVDFKVIATSLIHSHTLTHIAAKSATELAEGNIEYWYCSSCGKYFSNASATQEISKSQTVLAKLAHKHCLTHTSAKAATEQTAGNIEYWYCSACGKYFSDADATNEITQAQTIIAKTNHTHKLTAIAAKAATCTMDGNTAYWYCADCGKYFSDANAKNEISREQTVIAALGHNYVNGKCTRDGAIDPNYEKPAITQSTVPYPKTTLATGEQVQRTAQNLTVDGVAKDTEIYNINGSNYFMLRDIAALLNGTSSQFDIVWDATANTIVVTTGTSYAHATGRELKGNIDRSTSTVRSPQSIKINGRAVELTAYNIGGNNFFGLRALGGVLGFYVDYDSTTATMIVESR